MTDDASGEFVGAGVTVNEDLSAGPSRGSRSDAAALTP